MRDVFEWFVQRMTAVAVAPQHFAVDAPGFTSKIQSFSRHQKKLRAAFDLEESIGYIFLHHVPPSWRNTLDGDGTSIAAIVTRSVPDARWEAWWTIHLAETGIQYSQAMDCFLKFGRLFIHQYGFIFSFPNMLDAPTYAGNAGYATDNEEGENAGFWGLYPHGDLYLLRDIHHVMFLSRPYLDLPVEGITLEKWIQKDDTRGSLKNLNDRITVWTPPPDRIGAIRERLFLAGVLFYYRFFQTWEIDNPWARDFKKPFKPKDVPEIFRADYRRVIDPPVDTKSPL
jgi:hypothetical protein